MEWLGADAVADLAATAFASDLDLKHRMVFIAIDDATMQTWRAGNGRQARGEIARLVRVVRQSGARVVILDITFEQQPVRAEDDVELKNALESSGATLVLAAPLSRWSQDHQSYHELWPAPSYPKLLPERVLYAASLVPAAVIRSQPLFYCVFVHQREDAQSRKDRWEAMPSIAEAVRETLGTESTLRPPNCPSTDAMGTAAFFLIPPDRARPGGRPWKWFETISANQVSQAKEHLKNAIVIVGQNHSTSEDNHATPLGEMPGALVHANLIASLLHFGTEQKDEEGAKLLVEVSTVFVSATMITGLYWSAVEWLREKQRQPNRGKIWEFVASAFELIWFPVVVIFTALVVAAIDVLVGAKVLLRGVNIGSFVPVFGVILEGLVHIGHIIYGWLHRVASLIIDLTLRVVRKNAAAPVIFACVFCYSILGVVRAEEPIGSVGYLQVEGDKASVVVQRPGEIAPRSGDQVFEVFANDTIWVTNAGTRAWVRFYDVSLRLPEDGIEQGRPQYIVPQIPPPGSANWWYRIWHEHILPPPPSPGVPAHTQASRRNGPGADVPAMAVEHPDQLSPEDWTTATSGHPRHTAASKHRSGASAVGR